MRPNQNNNNNNPNNKNRQRSRNNNGGRKHINPLSRNFESNGPDVKVRGNAAHVAEKYLQLARDAQSAGDPVLAENYLQHAEHYFRIVAAGQPQNRSDQFGQPIEMEDEDDDFPPINDRFASPEPVQRFQPQPQDQPMQSGSSDDGEIVAVMPAPVPQPIAEQPVSEDSQAAAAAAEAEGGRRRERNRRRRRVPGEGREGAADPAAAPEPEVGELPAFLTAGTTPAAAE
jgi:hypothetical protein